MQPNKKNHHRVWSLPLSAVPRMVHVYRPAVDIRADRVASGFLALDQFVVASLAYRLDVAEIEEQCLVALVRLLVVRNSSSPMVPVAFYDNAPAALAGVKVTKECLLPDASRSAPAEIGVELTVLLGFGRARMPIAASFHI